MTKIDKITLENFKNILKNENNLSDGQLIVEISKELELWKRKCKGE